MRLTPTFLDGVFLALDAQPDVIAVMDSHRCEMERAHKHDTVHSRAGTLTGDGPFARNRRVHAIKWDNALEATGVEDALRRSLLEVTRRHPGVPVLVVRGFLSLFIHTDVEGVVASLNGRIAAPVLVVPQAAADDDWIDGWRQVHRALAPLARNPEGGDDRPLASGLFLFRQEGDELGNRYEIDRLLGRIGIATPRWLLGGESLPHAQVSATAGRLEFPYAPEDPGERRMDLPLPIGFGATTDFLRTAAAGLGNPADAEALVSEQRVLLRTDLLPYVARRLSGRGAAIVADPWRAHGLWAALRELGMDVPLVVVLRKETAPIPGKDEMEAAGTEVAVNPLFPPIQERISAGGASGELDILVGAGLYRDVAEDAGLASIEVSFPYYLEHFAAEEPFMGFDGLRRLAHRMDNAIAQRDYRRDRRRTNIRNVASQPVDE